MNELNQLMMAERSVFAQCATFKKEIEDRILNLRQSLVDYAHD